MSLPELTLLGQSGALLRIGATTVCVDPYLTDSVAERFGEQFRRLQPAPFAPGERTDLNWVLLTHAHADHTDLATLLPLLAANPTARVVAPYEARELLLRAGFPHGRLVQPPVGWFSLGPSLQLRAVPAAHLELETNGHGEWRYVGYLVRHGGGLLYHAGDTIPHPEILAALADEPGVDWALLPVNERNYFRQAQDIVGNMTVREAFDFAEAIGARHVIPIHWDLFAPNSVSPAEITLIHRLQPRGFELHLLPAGQPRVLASSPAE